MSWLREWRRESKTHKAIYKELGEWAREVGRCWACGRGNRDQPEDWYAPWFIQRAHFANQPRLEDRRVVILLCPLCHDRLDGRTRGAPIIDRSNCIFLKKLFDPRYFDPVLVRNCSIRNLPLPKDVAVSLVLSYERLAGCRRLPIPVDLSDGPPENRFFV